MLFLEDQEITRAEHVAFARRFGELEDHPVMASDRDHPGLVLIYKVRTREEQYENAYHCDTTWRECPQFGAVLRCTEAPEVGGDMIWCNMVMAYERLPNTSNHRSLVCALATASRRRLARRCQSKRGWR